MGLDRRGLFRRLAASAAGMVGATALARAAMPDEGGKLKVVYHLSDAEKVSFVLGNIRNHIEGAGGPDKVTIALVVHGSALHAFHASDASGEVKMHLAQLAAQSVGLNACGNTMKAQNVTLAQLLPGFVVADRGGVTRIAELQSQGYFYIRP
jgi:uncharacterized protein